ncbi:Cathelicidin-B1 [Dissostichus eleginoides]|uniref:Cathelicidin-B1 n=1 Tax=Dissostichus eleginoides TaxID=100907 RepID=A0AAD9CP95_DISEL|nr:Cathelicidin-B1 [Dissostichus eleginoides]
MVFTSLKHTLSSSAKHKSKQYQRRLILTGNSECYESNALFCQFHPKDGAITSHEDGAITSHEDGAITSHEDGAITSHEDGAITSHEDGAIISHEDGAITSHEDGAITSHEDGAITSHEDGSGNKWEKEGKLGKCGHKVETI